MLDHNGGHFVDPLFLSQAKMKLSELIEKVQSTDAEVLITKMDIRQVSQRRFGGIKELQNKQFQDNLSYFLETGH